ncbi:HAD family hydrolase [Aerococcus urinaeequi]|uniref:HAD family hydrolase n=1 Tax=Aerococcus urinaeequi TaxID=51665 RepID=UPI003D6C3F83
MIKALVFDLDDTLMPEYEYVFSGYRVLSNFLSKNYNLDRDKIYLQLVNLFQIDSKNVFNRLFDLYGISYGNEDIKELVVRYREHFPKVKPYNDVYRNLNIYRKQGYKLAIITDGFEQAQKNKIASLELEKYFDFILVTDEYGKDFWKPSPKPFEMVKNKLSVDFDEIMYIGDNPSKDFFIKKVYPITTVKINRDKAIHRKEPYLADIKEDYTIENLDMLTSLLIDRNLGN